MMTRQGKKKQSINNYISVITYENQNLSGVYRQTEGNLSITTGNVIKGITASTFYDDPAEDTAALTLLKMAFDQAVITTKEGARLPPRPRNGRHRAHRGSIKTPATSTSRAARIRDAPALRLPSRQHQSRAGAAEPAVHPRREPRSGGELKPRVKVDRTAKSIVGRIKPVGGEFGPMLSFIVSGNTNANVESPGANFVITRPWANFIH